jgi:hypothetical protein
LHKIDLKKTGRQRQQPALQNLCCHFQELMFYYLYPHSKFGFYQIIEDKENQEPQSRLGESGESLEAPELQVKTTITV